jgi:hypothetical protein
MPVLDSPLGLRTPMGATLRSGGAMVRTWAPNAVDVFVATDVAATAAWTSWTPGPADRLRPLGDGTWAGFVPAMGEGDPRPRCRRRRELQRRGAPRLRDRVPVAGAVHEVFNSDFYDHLPNPWVTGNHGGIVADGPAGATYPHSARLTIPANGALVFTREA